MAGLTTSSAAEELDNRIQALPQELQDMIIWSTEGFHIPVAVSINTYLGEAVYEDKDHHYVAYCEFENDYKPPLALRLNRKIRAQFANKYFSTILFDYIIEDHMELRLKPTRKNPPAYYLSHWLQSLSPEHKNMIRSLQVTEIEGIQSFYQTYPHHCSQIVRYLKRLLVVAGIKDFNRLALVLACIAEGKQPVEKYDIEGQLISVEAANN